MKIENFLRAYRVIGHLAADLDPDDPPPSRVDWILVTRPDGFRVGDVIFEGVSAVSTLKSDFIGAIRNGGGNFEALLTAMRAKMGSPQPGAMIGFPVAMSAFSEIKRSLSRRPPPACP